MYTKLLNLEDTFLKLNQYCSNLLNFTAHAKSFIFVHFKLFDNYLIATDWLLVNISKIYSKYKLIKFL